MPSLRTAERRGCRFCSGCGAPLADVEPGRKERKVVTVLFADLVGSTSRAEELDPEEVVPPSRSSSERSRA